MLDLVENVESLKKNVREYQKAVNESNSIKPGGVPNWYYVKSLDLVGASRFIGYENMTASRYEQEPVAGGRT